MADKSNIEWTDSTWNPVTGCSKVSQGCKNCYAERIWPKVEAAERMRTHWEWQKWPKRAFTDVRTHPFRLEAPLHWKKPRRIFVNSMSDLFHEDVPDDFIDRVFVVMALASQHHYQILTKRPHRMRDYCSSVDTLGRVTSLCAKMVADGLGSVSISNHADGLSGLVLENVWLGVSVEDQATADERIPLLLQTPAAVRFLSCEPLLGTIDLTRVPMPDGDDLGNTLHNFGADCGIDWVIAGGESGPQARPSHPDWFRSLRDQCAKAGVPFFMKQITEKGRKIDYETFPEDLRIREYPNG